MATFVLALIQIVKDIRFFMVVFFVVIFMFADMIHVMVTTGDKHLCDSGTLSDAVQDFCSTWSIEYYYRMYAVLLGDFEVDDYSATHELRITFFIFTIIGVIILLNVLIAVISDSYANSKEASLLLFGRARVGFVAQQIALESFLRPGRNPLKILQVKMQGLAVLGNHQVLLTWKWTSILIRWFVVLSLLGSALTASIFLLNEMAFHSENPVLFFLYLFFSVVLLISIWIVSLFVFGDFLRWLFRGLLRPAVRVADYWAQVFSYLVTVNVLGLNYGASSRDEALLGKTKKGNGSSPADEKQDDSEDRLELMEKIYILEKNMEKTMKQGLQHTRTQLSKRVDSLEEHLLSEERKERTKLMKQLSKLIEKLDSVSAEGGSASIKGAAQDKASRR